MQAHENLFRLQENARFSGNTEQAIAILNEMHRQYHDQAGIHIKVHCNFLLTYLAMRKYHLALKELLIIPTAAPASFFQKHFGLVRKNI